jgi:hypothetical protein
MRNRVARALIALGTVLALLQLGTTSPASADTVHHGDHVCSLYANSNGFGAYCSAGSVYDGATPPTWRERLGGRPFIPCRDFPVPPGLDLPAPPEGKEWVLRLTIVDYELDSNFGGPHAHLERAIVPVGPQERGQCPSRNYMDRFWTFFNEGYPSPVLVVKPTFTPRVNVPAYFNLTPDSRKVFKQFGTDVDLAYYGPGTYLTMQAIVKEMWVDPGDGTKEFKCLMGIAPADDDGYDETKDPFHQAGTCKHVYKRSSANQPDGMYTVKLRIVWDVQYWKSNGEWRSIGGTPTVQAVQRLPVQEVQTIGG